MIAAISYKPIPIFDLGPLSLSLHGLFAGLGFAVGGYLMVREAGRRGFDVDKVVSVLTWALVGAILGARLLTVPAHLGDPGYGFDNIVGLAGDFSILGGYAGGILVAWLRMRIVGVSVPASMDMATPGLAIGAVVGRVGDLAIVEHLGGQTSFFLGYELKPGYDVSPQHDRLEDLCERAVDAFCGPYHHTGLYDMIGAAVLLGVLFLLQRLWVHRRYGQIFSFWMIWYGMQRFLIDFTRLGAARDGVVTPDGTVVEAIADSVMGPFTGSQWGALGTAALGVLLVLWARRYSVVSGEADAELGALLEPSGEESGDGTATEQASEDRPA